jgi:MFS family permease
MASSLLLLLGGAAAAAPLAVKETAADDTLTLRRHPRSEARSGVGKGEAGASLGQLIHDLALGRREAVALLALCAAAEFAVGAFGVRLAVEMVQAGGWDPAVLSRLQGALALAAGTAGALAVGWWADRAGPVRALAALLALSAAAHLGAALLLAPGEVSGTPAACALALSVVAPALFFVALAPAVMLSSRGAAATTRFALYMASLNFGSVAGAAAAGPIGSLLTLWQTALAAALVFAVCAVAATRPRLLFRPGVAEEQNGSRTNERPRR